MHNIKGKSNCYLSRFSGDLILSKSKFKPQMRRLLFIDKALREGSINGQPPNSVSIARAYEEISPRTIARDIDFMKYQLGAPIEYDPKKKAYFYIDKTWNLPYIKLTQGDLFAILIAGRALEVYRGTPVARYLKKVFEKIAASLPEKISIEPEALYGKFTFFQPPVREISESIWLEVVRALERGLRLRIKYQAFDRQEVTTRKIDPYHLSNIYGEWYLIGFCHLRQELRQFTLALIQEAKVLDERFEVPKDFSSGEYFKSRFGRFASPGKAHRIKIKFSPQVAAWVEERQWHAEQKLTKKKDGSVILEFPAAGLYEVKRWVLSWGPDAEALSPKKLREWVREDVRGMGKVYDH